MAALTGVRAAVSLGGLLCFAGVGLLALGLPKLMAYDARTDEHARRMRERRAGAGEHSGDLAGPAPEGPDADPATA